MKATFATLAMAGAAAAAPHAGHAAFHAKKDGFGDLTDLTNLGNLNGVTDLVHDMSSLMTDGLSVMKKIGAVAATNSKEPTEDTWVAEATEGNAVVHTIQNKADSDFIFACWGAQGSWINVKAPTVAVRVPSGKNVTISHAIAQGGAGNSGACAPVFDETELVNGQISEAWMEFTFTNDKWASSTWDLSLEPNTAGHNMTITNGNCESSLTKCSFHCKDSSAKSCGESGSYELRNCESGSQPGASNYDLFGNPEGGCKGIEGTGIQKLTTIVQ